MSAQQGRVAGWDLLRGACALTVACYHLLYWLGIAEWPALGTYGVYLFFVLSGASLAYTYAPEQVRGARAVLRFLAARWLRLAPLYLLLCVLYVAMLTARNGAPVSQLGWRFALNASFAFGVHDPATWALLIGGWSLGIEFVFYLLFPWLLRTAPAPRVRWVVLAAFAGLQSFWIATTIGAAGWQQGSVAYHQVPAFGGYFFAGCVIGCARRCRPADLPGWAALAAWAMLGCLLALFMPARAGDELPGARGVLLASSCVLVVWVSGRARIGRDLSLVANMAGDITYGTYLLHPILLFGVAWFLLPIESMGGGERAAVLAGVLVTSCLLAWAVERCFERPIRRQGRALLGGGRPARPAVQSEVASISS